MKICPLTTKPCPERDCGWYSQTGKHCALGSLVKLEHQLERIANRLDEPRKFKVDISKKPDDPDDLL